MQSIIFLARDDFSPVRLYMHAHVPWRTNVLAYYRGDLLSRTLEYAAMHPTLTSISFYFYKHLLQKTTYSRNSSIRPPVESLVHCGSQRRRQVGPFGYYNLALAVGLL